MQKKKKEAAAILIRLHWFCRYEFYHLYTAFWLLHVLYIFFRTSLSISTKLQTSIHFHLPMVFLPESFPSFVTQDVHKTNSHFKPLERLMLPSILENFLLRRASWNCNECNFSQLSRKSNPQYINFLIHENNNLPSHKINCLTCIAKVPTPPEAPRIKTLQRKRNYHEILSQHNWINKQDVFNM